MNARAVGLSPTLGTIFPIVITPRTYVMKILISFHVKWSPFERGFEPVKFRHDIYIYITMYLLKFLVIISEGDPIKQSLRHMPWEVKFCSVSTM